jgi:filamentous hemagglutinin
MANKNTLTTGTLTTSDIQNHSEVKADASGISLSTDMLSQGKYGLAKAGLGTLLNNASDASASNGTSRSAVSGAAVVITDNAQQQVLTGKTATETIATLNTNTASSQQGVQKYDAEEMRKQVEAAQMIKGAVVAQVFKLTDESYQKMFIAGAKLYLLTKDANGKEIRTEVAEADRNNLQKASDGNVHVSLNGIFNDTDAAAKYALQHSQVTGPQYVIAFPEANNTASELFIAAYQKFMENDMTGLTNSTSALKNIINQYGVTGLQLDGHSRGALTINNALESKAREDASQGSLSGTIVHFYGPAANASQTDSTLSTLQNRDAISDSQVKNSMVLQFQNHLADPVGGWIGRNPSTGGTIPEGSSVSNERLRVMGEKDTAHNCYGDSQGRPDCVQFWSNGFPKLIPASPLVPLR